MDEPVYRIDRNQNRKMLMWFILALLIALLPWLLLADDQFAGSTVDSNVKTNIGPSLQLCEKMPESAKCLRQ